MAANSRREDGSSETEMENLQQESRLSNDSHRSFHKDTEYQHNETTTADRDKGAAYRKLYAIVTIMTMLLFALNILQVCLLPVISSRYWIVLVPGILFVGFIAWAWLFIASNRSAFFGEVGSFKDEQRRALQHLGALFFLRHRSERSYSYSGSQPSWPRRLERTGIFLTIFLNIILCQFIYLPIFAVPAFENISWEMSLNASQNISTPSLALIQNTELARRATLEDNATSIRAMCDQKMSDPVFRNLFCFQDLKEFTYGDNNQHHIRYVLFDGVQYPNVTMGTNLGLWYQYYYNSTASNDPLLSLAVFDRNLQDDFEDAIKCDIIPSTSFPAGDRNQASLRQVMINDDLNAMGRSKECRNRKFKHYNTYETDIVPLGAPSAPGHNNCDIGSQDPSANGSCNADITVLFSSTLTRVYSSEHGKDWITILTEEGGIVGFVTFLTWFFSIFKA